MLGQEMPRQRRSILPPLAQRWQGDLDRVEPEQQIFPELPRTDRRTDVRAALRELYHADPDVWVLPWAVLWEIDYLVQSRLGHDVEGAFLADLTDGRFAVESGVDRDLERAHGLNRQYSALRLGLVDSMVIAIAERLKAEAIATLDLKHFGALKIAGNPRLLPRDL